MEKESLTQQTIGNLLDDLEEISSYLDRLSQWNRATKVELETIKEITRLARSIKLRSVEDAISRRVNKLHDDINYVRDNVDGLCGEIEFDRQLVGTSEAVPGATIGSDSAMIAQDSPGQSDAD